MRVIDLLNKIANGEKVPKKIKFKGIDRIYEYNRMYNWFDDNSNDNCKDTFYICELNDEVETIEDKPEPKPITKKDLEALGYAFGEMKKALQNGWDKSLNNEPFKEDEKIKTINDFTTNVGVVDENNVEEYIHILFEQETILYFKINEIIDEVNKLKDDRK